MGLLDEAIREHLELKRRAGADPSAIAHAEREALAPAFPDTPVDAGGNGADGDGDRSVQHEGAGDAETVFASAAVDHRDGVDRLADLSAVGQETAELDMQAVMAEDPDAAGRGSPVGAVLDRSVPAVHSGETPAEAQLEWGVPSERDRELVPEDASGQERLSLE
jgi:hypothetical protein